MMMLLIVAAACGLGWVLGRTKVTDAGLAPLRKLANLRSLDLGETAVTEMGLVGIREWFPQAGVKPSMTGKSLESPMEWAPLFLLRGGAASG